MREVRDSFRPYLMVSIQSKVSWKVLGGDIAKRELEEEEGKVSPLIKVGGGDMEKASTTERLPFHFSLSCIGEGNGNPLQCSCLENPRDGGAWWAAIYGVAQSRT